MYRTSELRTTKVPGEVPELSSKKIQQLTKEHQIDVGSRIEILQTLAGYKWVGEAAHSTSLTKPSAPTKEQEVAISLLDNMSLACHFDWIERPGQYYSWIQFAINKPMLETFMDREHPFNVIEKGVVYGFPVSATLAFAGFIKKRITRQKDVANFYLIGVNSEKYYDREVEYVEKVWQHLRKIAPELTTEAYENYKKKYHPPAHT